MKIEVLGSGCKNCKALEAATLQALTNLGLDDPIDKVTDYGEIMAYGVMSTPALAIDGEIKLVGRVPSVDEITRLLAEVGN
ncbi:MAG: thioredoxin family protein [Actinomycetia bacterium]|nr:thioredoxin family protein [Actinomycetes bacterium]